METYKIKIFKAAKQDLKEIVEYINTLSPAAAIKYYDLLIEKISSLSNLPLRCPLAKDTQLRLKGYRFLVVENYIVFFVVKSNIIQIRRILYGSRRYDWML